MFDVPHDPSHLDPTLQREITAYLHLPSSPRTTPGTNLGKSSIDDHLVQVNEATESGEVLQRLGRGEGGEVEFEVGARSNVDGLEDAFGLDTINGLEVGRIISSNGTTGVALLQNIRSNPGGDVSEVMEAIHPAVQVSPDRFNLRYTEEEWMHQTEDVEGHLLGGERPDAVCLKLLGDQTSRTHQTSTTSPSGKHVRGTMEGSSTLTYPMTAPARQRYSPQLSALQRLKRVSKEILDSEYRPSLPKRP